MAVAITRPKALPVSLAALAAAGLWLYAPVLVEMARAWMTQDNASHGFLVAPIAAYVAWLNRGGITQAYQRGATAAGLAWAVVAALMYVGGRWLEVEFLPPLSLVFMVGAQVLYFGGWTVLRAAAFPYAFLFFMVPWPDLLVEFISFPMQLFSAKYATMLAGLLGLSVSRSGVDIHLPDYTFSVGAPCSGMKTLVALLALTALVAYLSRGPTWKRWALFAAGAPVALLANVVRIVVILFIAAFAGAEAAEGFLHGASGVVVFALALAGLLLLGRALGLRGIVGSKARGAADAPA